MEIDIYDNHIEYLVRYALGKSEETCKEVDLLVSDYLIMAKDFKYSNKISNIVKNYYFHDQGGQHNQEIKELEWWENTLKANSVIKDKKVGASHKSLSKMLKDICNLHDENKDKDVKILAADCPPFIGYVVYWEENSLEKVFQFTIDLKDAFKEENKEIKAFMGIAKNRVLLNNIDSLKMILKIEQK
jgi:hypothetical protein